MQKTPTSYIAMVQHVHSVFNACWLVSLLKLTDSGKSKLKMPGYFLVISGTVKFIKSSHQFSLEETDNDEGISLALF